MFKSFTSYVVQIIYISLPWTLYPLNLVCFLSSRKPKHSSSNHGFCCFNSCRLSLAELLTFSLIFQNK
jgi:hypothetical protein